LLELHRRRESGTLDLDLPARYSELLDADADAAGVGPTVMDAALALLRARVPLDEDAAILARIEREEADAEQALIARAELLGLYRPQGGEYHHPRAEDGDVRGRSVLEEVRQRNEAEAKARDEEERRRWLDGEREEAQRLRARREEVGRQLQLRKAAEEADAALVMAEARPRADPHERPALAWIQKHHVRATDGDADTARLTRTRRIVPSLLVVAATVAGSYLFAETYTPPEEGKGQRLWPSLPQSAATVLGLVGANVLVFALWRAFPPAWRLLNRYFISVPLYPYAASMVGSMFSHQMFRHLGMNMLILWCC
ncbi:hypothetical protein KEM52_004296, partial [Ascosphaera acerosa]